MSPAVIQSKLAVPPLGERLAARPRVSGLARRSARTPPARAHHSDCGCRQDDGGRPGRRAARPPRRLAHARRHRCRARAAADVPGGGARRRVIRRRATSRRPRWRRASRTPRRRACSPRPPRAMPMLLVVDGLERLAEQDAALAVVGALVRYAPRRSRSIALLSRTDVGLDLGDRGAVGTVATLGEAALAFTPEEAADALARAGRENVDPLRAVADTGGWVTGVLFEAWRSADHVQGVGGRGRSAARLPRDADPRRASPPAERELLEVTSLLDEVTARARRGPRRRARRPAPRRPPRAGICPSRGSRTAAACGRTPASASTSRSGSSVAPRRSCARCASPTAGCCCGGPSTRRRPRSCCGRVRAELAVAPAERAIRRVVERLDFALAERWLRRAVARRGRTPSG